MIVIAGKTDHAFFAHGLDAFAGLGTIADNVAGAEIGVDAFLLHDFHDGVESVVVSVNIAKNSVSQRKYSI